MNDLLRTQCLRAIERVLFAIKENPIVANQLGMGTQTFSELTQAYATLTGKPVAEIRELVIHGSSKIHKS